MSDGSNSWTKEEEFRYAQEIANGESIIDISKKHNRTVNDLDLRLKKIIYRNIKNGISYTGISNALKLDSNVIKTHYKDYKSIKKNKIQTGGNRDEKTDDINEKIQKKVSQLNKENKFMRSVIENKDLKKKLNNLIEDGTLDSNINHLLKKYRKNL